MQKKLIGLSKEKDGLSDFNKDAEGIMLILINYLLLYLLKIFHYFLVMVSVSKAKISISELF